MGPVVKAVAVVGSLWGLIGITNIFAGWTSEDPSYSAFLLMFNAFVFVIPGVTATGFTTARRKGPRTPRARRHDPLVLHRAKRWDKASRAGARP